MQACCAPEQAHDDDTEHEEGPDNPSRAGVAVHEWAGYMHPLRNRGKGQRRSVRRKGSAQLTLLDVMDVGRAGNVRSGGRGGSLCCTPRRER